MNPLVDEAEAHRRALWGVAYRVTGTVQDADEVVQDCFVRLLEHPPADPSRPLRPWLVAVTLNLARDRLRRRKRAPYVGPWLPAPVEDARLADERLALRESASWAWMCATEALTPTQRAVLVARDVLELTSAETAAALGTSPGAVDVALHRARAALGALPPAPTLVDDAVVAGFFALLQLGLPAVARRLLHPDAVAHNDGAGQVNAARRPIVGVAKLLTFFRRLARHRGVGRWSIVRANGLLTAVGAFDPHPTLRLPTRFTIAARVEHGRIVAFYSQLALDKLGGVSVPGG